MFIRNIADYLVNLTCKDIYSVFDSPCENNCPNNVNSEKLTILEILNAIGCRLKNLFGFVKINTSTETIDEDEAAVNVSGDVDNLNFDFKIPRGKTGPQGPAGPGVATGGTTGQILAKKSNANFDTEWVDNAGGGLTKTVLWTNSNPNSAFISQTITTPEDGFNYPLLIIDFAETATSAVKLSTVVTNMARFGTNFTMLNDYKGYRTIRTVNGISWTVSAGFNLSTNANDNAICIPLNIIGYK